MVIVTHNLYMALSHNFASRSDITLCNKINKPLVVCRFSGNVMACIRDGKILTCSRQKCDL